MTCTSNTPLRALPAVANLAATLCVIDDWHAVLHSHLTV